MPLTSPASFQQAVLVELVRVKWLYDSWWKQEVDIIERWPSSVESSIHYHELCCSDVYDNAVVGNTSLGVVGVVPRLATLQKVSPWSVLDSCIRFRRPHREPPQRSRGDMGLILSMAGHCRIRNRNRSAHPKARRSETKRRDIFDLPEAMDSQWLQLPIYAHFERCSRQIG